MIRRLKTDCSAPWRWRFTKVWSFSQRELNWAGIRSSRVAAWSAGLLLWPKGQHGSDPVHFVSAISQSAASDLSRHYDLCANDSMCRRLCIDTLGMAWNRRGVQMATHLSNRDLTQPIHCHTGRCIYCFARCTKQINLYIFVQRIYPLRVRVHL